MELGADIFIGANRPPHTIRTAFARAYDVPVNQVAIRRSQTPWPSADVILEYVREDGPVPGHYPIQILPWGPVDRTDEPDTLTALAVALGVPVLTSSDSYDPLDMELYLPDGTMYHVSVDQDDDGGIRNTTVMRRLIEQHSRSAAIAS